MNIREPSNTIDLSDEEQLALDQAWASVELPPPSPLTHLDLLDVKRSTHPEHSTRARGDVCPKCAPMHLQVGTISGGFVNPKTGEHVSRPPYHPGCRCKPRPYFPRGGTQ